MCQTAERVWEVVHALSPAPSLHMLAFSWGRLGPGPWRDPIPGSPTVAGFSGRCKFRSLPLHQQCISRRRRVGWVQTCAMDGAQ